ncbi:MAG: PD40 domain-containing protein [Deltaproteobacteria bacterium]|nr:PD40 domain-containing protein [Deltaproteobacteria bacterium]
MIDTVRSDIYTKACRGLFAVFFAVLFLVLFCMPRITTAGYFDGKTKFYTVKTEHFYIHFSEGLGPVANEMKTISEEGFDRLTARTGWTPKGRTHVVLTDKTDLANGMATVMPYNYVLLYVAPPTVDSSLSHYKDYHRLLFNHEFAHILHIDKHSRVATPFRYLFGKIVAMNGATPSWMREGMAVYEESRVDEGFGRANSYYTDMVMRTSVVEDKFPKIDQIAGSSSYFPEGKGPYLFGGEFFDWLALKYGEDRMYKYQDLYASGLWVFSLNNKARRVYGKSFYKLWDEFKSEMTAKYQLQTGEVKSLGLTTLNDVVSNKNSQDYFIPHPNGRGYAYFERSLDDNNKIIIKTDGAAKPQEIARALYGQMTFSKNGRYLAFTTLASVEPKTAHFEVYYYDTKDKKLFRVVDKDRPNPHKAEDPARPNTMQELMPERVEKTCLGSKKAMRVKDPDFAPFDGGQRWLVMVRDFLNTDQLYLFDLYEKKGYVITSEPKYTQLSNPRFSPDGQRIVVSRKDPTTGFRDIVIYSKTGAKLSQITNDIAPDAHPVFAHDGESIYFDSYRTGIANIFRYHFKQHALTQLTNVVDGVFKPTPSVDNTKIYVERYSSDRTFVQSFNAHYRNSKLPETKLKPDAGKKNKTGVISNGLISGRNYSLVKDDPSGNRGVALAEHPLSALEYPMGDGRDFFDDHDVKETSLNHDPLKKDLHTQTRLDRFSQAPDVGDYLPDFFYGDLANKKDQGDVLKHKKKETVVVTDPEGNKIESDDGKDSDAAKTPRVFPSKYKDELGVFPPEFATDSSNPPDAKKYHALPQMLVPRYLLPSLTYIENSFIGGLTIGRTDPLYRHSWVAFVNYRSDAQFLGGGGTYVFSRYSPSYYLGAIRYAVDWGDIGTTRFFEQRTQAYAGTAFAINRHKFNLAYFYEDRAALTNLAVNLVNMKPYAGLRFKYSISNAKKYPNSISLEDGYKLSLGSEWSHKYLGSNGVNEEIAVHGDFRYYFEMPWSDHHVLAIRSAGGWVWGDVQQFGVYRMGGPFGEGVGAAAASSRLFPLRGLTGITYGGDRAVLFSAEYRLPLITSINRGIGTWPVFFDKLYINFFVDSGDIKYRAELDDLFTRMMTAVGAELSSDMVLGYGLPVQLRLGYGVILTNRDRLGTMTDATTTLSLKYGSPYFQFGTMF